MDSGQQTIILKNITLKPFQNFDKNETSMIAKNGVVKNKLSDAIINLIGTRESFSCRLLSN